MANNARINIGVGFTVDKTGLNKIKASLDSIKNATVKDMVPTGNLQNAEKELQQIKHTASEVEAALERSFNTNLGTLNVSKFNQELKQLNVKRIQNDFSKLQTVGQNAFRNLATDILTTNVQLKQTNKFLNDMAQTFANTFRWGISSSVFNALTGFVQEAYGQVKGLDSSLNDIRIVTEKSTENMRDFAKEANKTAKILATGTKDYTNASLIYYQQGLSEKEVKSRTDTTIKAANVTKQSPQEVSEQLTAVWNGYKASAQETEVYVDKLAAVAASTASDLEELSTGMSKVASSANATGVNIDQLSGQLSTIISVTRQAPESVGTALKTIYARLSDLKLGGVDEEGIGLGEVSGTLSRMGVQILDETGNLREMGDVIEEIGGKWKTWNEAEQIAMAQVMAGKRQYNNLVALFENFDMYEAAKQTSENSLGTLQKQQEIYLESIEAHLQKLGTAAEDVYDSLIDPESINPLIDGLTLATDLLAKFIDTIGGGGGALLLLGNIALKVFNKQIASGIANMILNTQKAKLELNKLAAEAELTQQLGSVNKEDSRYQNLLKMKEEQLKYSNLLTQQEKEATNELIKQTNELYKQQDALIARKQQAEASVLKQTGNVVNLDSMTPEQAKTIMNDLDSQEKNIQERLKGISGENDIQKFIRNVAHEEAAYNADATKAKADKLKDAMDAFEEQVNYTLKEGTEEDSQYFSTENILKIKEARDQYKKALQESGDNAADTKVQQAAINYQKAYQVALKDTAAQIKETRSTVKNYTAEQNNLNTAVQNTAESFKYLKSNFSLRSVISTVVQTAQAFGQLAMAVQTVVNLFPMFADEDISTGEKILRLIIAISTVAPMLVSSFSALGKSLDVLEEKKRVDFYNQLIAKRKEENRLAEELTAEEIKRLGPLNEQYKEELKAYQLEQQRLKNANIVTKTNAAVKANPTPFMKASKKGNLYLNAGLIQDEFLRNGMSPEDAEKEAKLFVKNYYKGLAQAGKQFNNEELNNLTSNLRGQGILREKTSDSDDFKNEIAAIQAKAQAETTAATATETATVAKQQQTVATSANVVATEAENNAEQESIATGTADAATSQNQTISKNGEKTARWGNVSAMMAEHWWISLIAVAAVALTAVIVSTVKAYNSQAEAAKEASENAENLKKHYTDTKKAYTELLTTISDYSESVTAISQMVKGTEEFEIALEDANDKARELLDTYKNVLTSGDYFYDENGVLQISSEGLDKIEQEAQDRKNKAYRASLSADVVSQQAQQDLLKQQIGRSFIDTSLISGYLSTVSGAQVISDSIPGRIIAGIASGGLSELTRILLEKVGFGEAQRENFGKDVSNFADDRSYNLAKTTYERYGEEIFTAPKEDLINLGKEFGLTGVALEKFAYDLSQNGEEIVKSLKDLETAYQSELNDRIAFARSAESVQNIVDSKTQSAVAEAIGRGGLQDEAIQKQINDIKLQYDSRGWDYWKQQSAKYLGYNYDAATGKLKDSTGEEITEEILKSDSFIKSLATAMVGADQVATQKNTDEIRNTLATIRNTLKIDIEDAATLFGREGQDRNTAFDNTRFKDLKEISSKDINFSSQELAKMNYSSQEEFIKNYNEAIKNAQIAINNIIANAADTISEEALNKLKENTGKETLQNLSKTFDIFYNEIGSKGTRAFSKILDDIPLDKMDEFSTRISTLLSEGSLIPYEELDTIMSDLGITVDLTDSKWQTFINNIIDASISADKLTSSLESMISKLDELEKLKDIKINEKIDAEEFTKMVELLGSTKANEVFKKTGKDEYTYVGGLETGLYGSNYGGASILDNAALASKEAEEYRKASQNFTNLINKNLDGQAAATQQATGKGFNNITLQDVVSTSLDNKNLQSAWKDLNISNIAAKALNTEDLEKLNDLLSDSGYDISNMTEQDREFFNSAIAKMDALITNYNDKNFETTVGQQMGAILSSSSSYNELWKNAFEGDFTTGFENALAVINARELEALDLTKDYVEEVRDNLSPALQEMYEKEDEFFTSLVTRSESANQGVQKLYDNWQNYVDILNNPDLSVTEQSKVYSEISDILRDSFDAEVSSDFVKNNFDTISKMLSGNKESIIDFQKALGENVAETQGVGKDAAQKFGRAFSKEIGKYDFGDIIDSKEMKASLAEMIMDADDVSKALADIPAAYGLAIDLTDDKTRILDDILEGLTKNTITFATAKRMLSDEGFVSESDLQNLKTEEELISTIINQISFTRSVAEESLIIPEMEDPMGKLDYYYEINRELRHASSILKRLQTQAEHLVETSNISDNLKTQTAQMQTQIRKYYEQIEIAQSRANFAATKLKQQYSDIRIDQNGYISNYLEVIEREPKAYEAMEEYFGELEQATSIIDSARESIQDLNYSIVETQVKTGHVNLQVNLDVTEATKTWTEFYNKYFGKNVEFKIIGLNEPINQLEDTFDRMSALFGNSNDGLFNQMVEQVKWDIEEINKGLQGAFAANGEFDATKARETLKEDFDKLTEAYGEIVDASDLINKSWNDIADSTVETYEKLANKFEQINNAIDHGIKVLSFQNPYSNPSLVKELYQSRVSNSQNAAAATQEAVSQLLEMFIARGWKDNRPTLGDEDYLEYTEWLNKINSTLINSAESYEKVQETLVENYSKAIETIFYDTFGSLKQNSDSWEYGVKKENIWLNSVDSAYELEKLGNKYEKLVQNNLKYENLINKAYAQQMKALREKDKLSEEDLKRANLRYELLVKQIALEESQNNKNAMRLRRDASGNYSYEFVADESDTIEKEQAVQDAWYNMTKNDISEAQKTGQDYFKNLQAYQEALAKTTDPKNIELINSFYSEQLKEDSHNFLESAYGILGDMFLGKQSQIDIDNILKGYNLTAAEVAEMLNITTEQFYNGMLPDLEMLDFTKQGMVSLMTKLSGTNDSLVSSMIDTSNNIDIVKDQLVLDAIELADSTKTEIDKTKETFENLVGNVNSVLVGDDGESTSLAQTLKKLSDKLSLDFGGAVDTVNKKMPSLISNMHDFATQIQSILGKFAEDPNFSSMKNFTKEVTIMYNKIKDLSTKKPGSENDGISGGSGGGNGGKVPNSNSGAPSTSTGDGDNKSNTQKEKINNTPVSWGDLFATGNYQDERGNLLKNYNTNQKEDIFSKLTDYTQRDEGVGKFLAEHKIYDANPTDKDSNAYRMTTGKKLDFNPDDYYYVSSYGGIYPLERNSVTGEYQYSVKGKPQFVNTNDKHIKRKTDVFNNMQDYNSFTIVNGDGSYNRYDGYTIDFQDMLSSDVFLTTDKDNKKTYWTMDDIRRGGGYVNFISNNSNKPIYSLFDTGGYTGEWGDEGKLAVLHQKELILNSKDTENILNAVSIIRTLQDKIFNMAANAQTSQLQAKYAESIGNVSQGNTSKLDQNVSITAEFPNVTSSFEIENALNNLVNVAAQRAYIQE